MKPQSKTWLQALLSLFVVFHLSVMVVLANGSSFFGRSFQAVIVPYGNLISLNTTWNFFSPDPAHTMYLRYFVEFLDSDGNELQEPIEGFVPPDKEKISIDSSERRFLYAMRFLIIDQSRMETLLGPWLCKRYAGATFVSMEQSWRRIPSLDEARASEKFELKDEETVKKLSYECNKSMAPFSDEEGDQ